MPQPYLWTKLEQRGDAKVSGRSGHTLTATAAGLVLFGGVDGRLDCNENPAPNNDVYLLNINRTTATWRELRIPLAQRPPPRAMHSCTALSSNLLFFFGGCSSASPFVCKNDTWTLDVSTQTFKRIVCKGEETEDGEQLPESRLNIGNNKKPDAANSAMANLLPNLNLTGASPEREDFLGYMSQLVAMEDLPTDSEGVSTETSASLPPPRCSHTASLWRSEGKSKIVVFGGHGGYRYTRKALNDVWILDLTDLAWTEVRYTGNAPAPRYARVEERSVSRCSDFFQFEVICIRLSRHTCRGTAA